MSSELPCQGRAARASPGGGVPPLGAADLGGESKALCDTVGVGFSWLTD
jgi:hypothetical protein